MAIATGLSWPRNGFTPVRRDNTTEQYTMRFPASCGAGNNPIGIGAAVAYVGGVCVPCTAGQDPAQRGFGIVVGVFNSSGRPFTQQANKLIVSGANGQVDVLYDPNAEFIVRCETSVGFTDMLKNVVLSDTSATAGLSRVNLSVNLPASASVSDLFKFVRFATQVDLAAAGVGGLNTAAPAAGAPIVVRWNNHVFAPKTSGS